MRKIKTILGIVFSLAIVTTMNTTVFAANDSGIPERRGVYIRECVGYEPNYTNIDYTHKLLGSVSGDNTQGSSPMQITYQYEQSGTTTASIAGYANGTTEANVVFAKMQAEVGVEVTGSRSWTKGTSAGVSYSIAPGKFEVLNVYIPAVRTAGRLKYKVYIYNTGSRTGLIDSLREMRGELSPEETELRELTDSALCKLQTMTDDEFVELDLYPDFDQ